LTIVYIRIAGFVYRIWHLDLDKGVSLMLPLAPDIPAHVDGYPYQPGFDRFLKIQPVEVLESAKEDFL
jgi:hypothetical protein